MATSSLLAAAASSIVQVTGFGSNPAGLTMYEYVPDAMPPNAPLVLVMHGCTQGAQEATAYGWNAVADAEKFYVVYPEETTANNPMRCFNWAGVYGDPTNLQRGKGENLSIKQMVDKMEADHAIDPKRVFVTGFSAGGAEALLMLATWPDVFAGGAAMSGVAYDCGESVAAATSCMKPGKDQTAQAWGDLVRKAYPGYAGPWPRVSLWHGTGDSIVSFVNLTQAVRQWTDVHGVPETPTSSDTVAGFPHHVFGGVVESYEITGMDHAMAVDPAAGCGVAGAYVNDEKICAAERVAEFFGLTGSTPPITDAGTDSATATDSGTEAGTDSGTGTGTGTDSGTGTGTGTLPHDAGIPHASSGPPAAADPPAFGDGIGPNDSVCACRAAGKPAPVGGPAIAGAAIAVAIRIRRRRTRASARG